MGLFSGLRGVFERMVAVLTGVIGASDRPTRDEIKPLNVSIDTGTIDPNDDTPIPIEVSLPSEGPPSK